MKFTTAFIVLVASTFNPVFGFNVGTEQPDGVYEVSMDSNGEFIHTKLSEPVASLTKPVWEHRPRVTKREGLDQVYCFNQDGLDHGECDAANADLDRQIGPNGRGLGSHLSIYSKRGNVVAYCCNNRSQGNTCYSSVRQQASRMITDKCGYYRSGAAYDSGAHLTYGYQGAQYNFCPGS